MKEFRPDVLPEVDNNNTLAAIISRALLKKLLSACFSDLSSPVSTASSAQKPHSCYQTEATKFACPLQSC